MAASTCGVPTSIRSADAASSRVWSPTSRCWRIGRARVPSVARGCRRNLMVRGRWTKTRRVPDRNPSPTLSTIRGRATCSMPIRNGCPFRSHPDRTIRHSPGARRQSARQGAGWGRSRPARTPASCRARERRRVATTRSRASRRLRRRWQEYRRRRGWVGAQLVGSRRSPGRGCCRAVATSNPPPIEVFVSRRTPPWELRRPEVGNGFR